MRRHLALPVLVGVLLVFPLVLSACGSNPTSGAVSLDNVHYVKKEADLNKENQVSKTVKKELYLLDENGQVSPQVVKLPDSKSLAKETLEYLVKDGPVSNILPNGFSAVLPAGTTVKSVDLHSDGTLVANFSKDLLDYKASEEQAILQSITWTLTQFKDIKRVQIEIDGKRQVRMPIDNTEIGSGLTRSDGINTNLGNVVDVAGSESVTLYYLSVNKGHEYYVPVTTRIKTGGGDDLTNVVNALIIGPTHDGLTSTFGSDVALLAKPVIKNGIVTLNFNEALYTSIKNKTISDDAINCLVLTLTNEPGIQKVNIKVDGKDKMMMESGKPLTNPVSRPVVNQSGV